MAEQVTRAEGYKIWRNPADRQGGPVFMGSYYPPRGHLCFYQADLQDLGFPPGSYTIRVPDSVCQRYALPQWQAIELPE